MLKIKASSPVINESEKEYECFDENDNVLFNRESLITNIRLKNGDIIVHTNNDIKTNYSVLKLKSFGAGNAVILLRANSQPGS